MHLQFDPQRPKTRTGVLLFSYRTATDFERTQLKSHNLTVKVSKILVKWKIENRKWNERTCLPSHLPTPYKTQLISTLLTIIQVTLQRISKSSSLRDCLSV